MKNEGRGRNEGEEDFCRDAAGATSTVPALSRSSFPHHPSFFIISSSISFLSHFFLIILISPSLHHATRHAQRGADGGKDSDNGLNDKFPSFFLHNIRIF